MKPFIVAASAAALFSTTALTTTADDVSEQMRDVPAFEKVSLNGSMDVEISVGGKQSVKVIADSQYIDNVETIVENGRLKIDLESHRNNYYRNIKEMRVVITVPELTGASLRGSGDMSIENAKATKFDFDLKGSGDAKLTNIDVSDMSIDLAGSGDFSTNGNCEAFEVRLRGSGDIRARDFKCNDVDVSVRGSGDVRVFADNSADISVRGSGDVDVYGGPDNFSSSVRGSGDITRH